MIVALYKDRTDAGKRALLEGELASVKPTAEANEHVAKAWPDYPWAVVNTPRSAAESDTARMAERAMAR